MNRYYDRDFNKNTAILNRHSSTKGIYKKSRSSSTSVLEMILSLIDSIIACVCSAKTRIIAKAVFGFVCLVGVIGIIGRLEMGTLPLLSGCIGLALIIAIEFLVVRQK